MKIQFLKDTSKAIIPKEFESDKTLIIYREGYKFPEVREAIYIDFEKYKSQYISMTPDNIIMIGINRIFVPANRCDMVFEYLQTMTSHINKMSIDTSPFIGEPWRLWFHYSVVYGTFLGINYSYAVETDWQHWFYRDSENCMLKNVAGSIHGTYSDLDILKTEYGFYEPNKTDFEYYGEVKKLAFEKYGTPKQIIQMMLKNTNNHFNIKVDFDSYLQNRKIVMPNLGIYRFVVEESKRRQSIYNQVISKK